jgi:hypothetical protein
VKIKPRPSLFLWTFICFFAVFWLGFDLWSGIYNGEIQDLRTGNKLLFDVRPIWFSVVFILKSLAMMACIYFLYGVAQIVRVMFKNARRNRLRKTKKDV